MLRIRMASALAAVCCLAGVVGTASAAQVDSGQVYCFSQTDFSQEEPLAGICLTDLPKEGGCLRLGSRVLQPGDILTAQQVEQMTFSSLDVQKDQSVEVGYLPIYADRVAPAGAMTISIRGREDKPPVAEDSALETYKNLPNTGKLKAADPEGEALTFTLTRQPKRGSVELDGAGGFSYTPRKNKIGIDSFTYTATDPAGQVSREATVTITILKPSDSTQYTDTTGLSCRFEAEWMRQRGIFTGEKLGGTPCFSPAREVTRGEFVTMLVKALDIPVEPELTYAGCTDEIPSWLQPYLAAAVRSGLTAGLPEQQVFGPDEVITGAEAGVMLQNALDLPWQQTSADWDQTAPEWAAAAMNALHSGGYQLDPLAPLTRETAASILYQASKEEKQFPM